MKKQEGFTLFELLTVIVLIGLVLLIGMGMLKNPRSGATQAAITLSEEAFDHARTLAVATGQKTRLLVDAEVENEGSYLRRIRVVYFDEESEKWIPSGSGSTLPQSAFFSPKLSKLHHRNGVPFANKEPHLLKGADSTKDYYYFEFNPVGLAANPECSFVVISGALPPGGEVPRIIADDKEGLVIKKNGRTTRFLSPSQI